jgi:hypothetical protein
MDASDRFTVWVLFWGMVTALASMIAVVASLLTGVWILPAMTLSLAIPASLWVLSKAF